MTDFFIWKASKMFVEIWLDEFEIYWDIWRMPYAGLCQIWYTILVGFFLEVLSGYMIH